ncbi:M20 family metallopeptidase [Heyndrickxia ginsengihumi]|uniref:M20 family metallopeptidase n=1 Tax=Heyndrickxia ginsengihumi TaxID=363870 RepID=UPI003D1E0E74
MVTIKTTMPQHIEQVKQEVIEWRRYLHAHPELSFEEVETANFVYNTLQSFGGIELSRPTNTSVLGIIKGASPGKTIAIRADMDALPIDEKSGVPFSSKKPGVMHACGHDGHTAMLLGTAKVLSQLKDNIAGEVRLIFQHAEEIFPGGAEELVHKGVMDGVEAVIGAHLWSPLEVGKIGIVYGPMMASPDTFNIIIKGKGGHAAMPHDTVDSIATAAQVVSNLQHIVSRNVNPLKPVVVSVAKFIGGTTHNVIPGSVEIMGTVRTFDPDVRKDIPIHMERIVKGITAAHNAEYEFDYSFGYRAVINDDDITQILEETMEEVYGSDAIERMDPSMVGEDFSAYQQVAKGAFFYIGAGNADKGMIYPHHHEQFMIDEQSLEKGVSLFTSATFKFLA